MSEDIRSRIQAQALEEARRNRAEREQMARIHDIRVRAEAEASLRKEQRDKDKGLGAWSGSAETSSDGDVGTHS
jgi:hypothetical protein